MIESRPFTPDWVSPPGDTIENVLEERGWSKAEFADRTGFTAKHVNELVKGRVPITADAAERLSRVLGSTTQFWLVREAQYRSALERRRVVESAAADVDWLDELPLAWMRKRGWVETVRDRREQVIECHRFFGVASVEVWRTYYAAPLLPFVGVEALDGKQIGSLATWLRKGEIETGRIGCAPFDKPGLRAAVMELRGSTSEDDPSERIVEVCAAHGVAVAFVPAPPGCPVTGATRWLTADKAMLLLSSRHRSNDRLWFSFFHEIAHLLLHGKKLLFIHPSHHVVDALEREASQLANRLLIPDHGVRCLAELSKGTVTEVQITTLAEQLGVAPGILVSRMQAEGWLASRQMNRLKVRYARAEDG